MPSVSKQQQKFFGVVKAMQKGDIPKKGSAGKAAKTMDKDDVDDFASTKHKGLPKKVKREMKVRELIRKLVREILDEGTCGYGINGELGEEPAGPHLIKKKEIEEGKGVDKVLDMANNNSFGKLAGKTVDAMSANLFKKVYDKANDTAKEKMNKMNEKQLYVFMTKLWSKFSKQVRI